jgi:hypothetical protein
MKRPFGSLGIGWILALVALVLEIIYWATTRDSSLGFYALVLTTLAVLL